MRSFGDRVRHAVLFELIGLATFTPLAAIVFNQPIAHMGVIGVVGATLGLAIPFQKGNPAFQASLDRALQRIKADGRLMTLV